MHLKLNLDNLIEIYMISNAPLFFYKTMRMDTSIQELSETPTKELIEEFEKRATQVLTDVSELVEVYAIYIALTFKNIDEVKSFFESAKTIKYDWFNIIAEIYLLGNTHQSLIQNIKQGFVLSSQPETVYPKISLQQT